MPQKNALYLHEEVMLLALKDKEGIIASGTHFSMAMGGAFLAELLLSNRITVETQKKKKFAQITDTTPFGETLLDECLGKIVNAKRRQQLQTWVQRFSGLKNLKNRTAQQLIQRGILRADEDKVLLIFTRKIYPEVNPIPEKELLKRLHNAIFTDAEDIDPRTVVLLSIANSAELLKLIFDKKELKQRKKRIEQVINGEMTGKATKEAIEAMQAAIVVACIIPAVVVATSSAAH
jgi:hypothetical protein